MTTNPDAGREPLRTVVARRAAGRCIAVDLGTRRSGSRVVIGECAGGEGESQSGFSADWDPELASEVAPSWIAHNYMSGRLMDVDELLRVTHTVLRLGATTSIPSVTVMPRRA